ncbi:disulfide bond formation protein B [Uliginosibacterium paludis]|uniref:Disulfide bond formation protein B n=1 Tax=Uliginosibacterium paludis TaxID=1615952 RepID=A0ABV2CRZ4_9RHOO
MHARFPLRPVFVAICVYSFGLIGFGLLLQSFKGITPCPMCIMQRYAFVGAGLIGLLGAIHNPNGFMRRVYAFLIFAVSLAGLGVAIRQSWLQHFPPTQTVCGPDLSYMLNSFPLGEALPMLFQGYGDCSVVDWTFLGLSIAEWSIVNFMLIAGFAFWQMVRTGPERRRFG